MLAAGRQISTEVSLYQLCDVRHRLIGLWRPERRQCGLSIMQSLEGEPRLAIGLVITITGEEWEDVQLRPFLLCTQGTGPFIIKKALERLEVFDEGDVDLKVKLKGAWQELVCYGDTQDAAVCWITADSYRKGLKPA